MSKKPLVRISKHCEACGKLFDVVPSYANKARYCSYDPCFLSTRKTRQPKVTKKCESCDCEFTVPFTRKDQRFCSRRCAVTGEHNGMYGKPGTMRGRKAWNNGLSAKTDARVAALGQKISTLAKVQFATGERSHVGVNNPMYGHTAEMMSPAQRASYSRAAVARVLAGVSGYKTGHITGIYLSPKSTSPVRFKSSWELAAMMWWDRSSDIALYAYEPDVIELNDGRRAIPDFYVTDISGKSMYVEIKPTAIQALPAVAERLAMVRAQVESRGEAYVVLGNSEIDAFRVLLGKEFTDAIERYKSGSKDVHSGVPVR